MVRFPFFCPKELRDESVLRPFLRIVRALLTSSYLDGSLGM